MANYVGAARTNYVTIENLQELTEVLNPWPLEIVKNSEGKVAFLSADPDSSGWPYFGVDVSYEEVELDVASVIMPFVKEGEVLLVMEAGHEKLRYISGWASAWIRRGDTVSEVTVSLNDIYQKAAEAFNVDKDDISVAEY
jgi:hypothetical protein